jgi:hypothetical protein
MVMGRLYKIIKRDPVKNLKQFSDRYEFWSWDEIRRLKFSRRKGDHITAEIIGKQFGVGQATVRNAEKFADAVETLQEISSQAAERVLRGEVRDALTELPKVPPEVLPFVAKKIEEGARSIKQILREWRQRTFNATPQLGQWLSPSWSRHTIGDVRVPRP